MKSNLSAVQRTVLYTVTQEYGVDRPIVYSNNKIILQLKEFFILYFTFVPPIFRHNHSDKYFRKCFRLCL